MKQNKIKNLLNKDYIEYCLFCKHYHTACGKCKGQELEICGNYVDVDEVSLRERIVKLFGRVK